MTPTIILFFVSLAFILFSCIEPAKVAPRWFKRNEPPRPSDLTRPRHHIDDLTRCIIQLIEDEYAPYVPVHRTDRLWSDLELDAQAIRCLIDDIGEILQYPLDYTLFRIECGLNPSIRQLVDWIKEEADIKD